MKPDALPLIFSSYYGPYTIDAAKNIVTIHVEGASDALYLKTNQIRPFKISGDTLMLGIAGQYRATR